MYRHLGVECVYNYRFKCLPNKALSSIGKACSSLWGHVCYVFLIYVLMDWLLIVSSTLDVFLLEFTYA